MKKNIQFFLVLSTCCVYAQESLNSSGDNAIGTGGSSSYSVGQMVYSNYSGIGGNINEGVQQSYEIFVLSTTGFEDINAITLYPNPNFGQLFLNLKEVNENLYYSITNMSGKVIMKDTLSQLQTQLNIDNLPSDIYIVTIASKDNSKQKVFKIIKK